MSRRGVNKLILIGHLGQAPEVLYMLSGSVVVSTSVATNDFWKDKQTGVLQEHTEWHRVSLFDQHWATVKEHLKKGSHVYIEGTIRTRKWKNQNGVNQYVTEIIAQELLVLDLENNTNSVVVENDHIETIKSIDNEELPF